MFDVLIERGFLRIHKASTFTLKTKEARTWEITAERCGDRPATRDFMRWAPCENSEHSSTGGTGQFHRRNTKRPDATSLPVSVPPAEPSEASNALSQFHGRNTYNLPSGVRGNVGIDSLTATTDQPAEQSQSIPSTANLYQPVESIPDQPTDQSAGRQHRRPRPEDGRDPQVMDLEDLIALKAKTSATGQTSPTDKLRADLKAKLADAPKGTQKALARLVSISPCHLSNFLGGRFSLNHGALARLQDWIDGRLAIAPIGDAA